MGRWLVCLLLGGITLLLTGCSATKSTELTVVAFSSPALALQQIIPQFEREWQQKTGQTVRIYQSYGASGTQTRALIDGLPGDVAYLAIPIDVYNLQKAGLVKPGWEQKFPHNSTVTRSVVALAVRPNNPQNITDWGDLTRPGVKVITANPKTSGVARWNFLSLLAVSNSLDYVAQVYRNTPILPKNAREATDIFTKRKQGDVLLNYEHELVLARLMGQKVDFLVPPVNFAIEHPVVVIDRNVDRHGNRAVAEAFVRYLYSPPAQRELAKIGFRPTNPAVSKEFQSQFAPIAKLLTIRDLGGWERAQTEFFQDGGTFNRILQSLSSSPN